MNIGNFTNALDLINNEIDIIAALDSLKKAFGVVTRQVVG